MRIVKIRKKRGSYRTIYIPNLEEKRVLYDVLPSIALKAKKFSGTHVHGFIAGRSAVTAASLHVGYEWTYSVDLRDFFNNCNESMLKGLLTKEEMGVALIDGAPQQGLPTSPAVANLAAKKMDEAILKFVGERGIVYTRYADDLTFSGNGEVILEELKTELPKIIGRCGFKIAPEKTSTYFAKNGRRMILGIGVDDKIHPSRAAKRRLRAAIHQKNNSHANGLAEYCKLKPPKQQIDKNIVREAKQLMKWFKIRGSLTFPVKHDPIPLGPDAEITADPVQMLGMSLYTTNWKSCYSLKDGGYRRATRFLCNLKGASIAVLYHPTDKKSFGGVERRLMRARTIVYTLTDGTKCCDNIYGEPEAKLKLDELLIAQDIPSIHCRRNRSIVGYLKNGSNAHFDNITVKQVSVKSGGKTAKMYKCVT